MIQEKTRRGFTLIELLVVVLIIGILAAVALPQYQKAVEKARFAAFIPLIKAVADAKSIYYLENGNWPEKFEVLSVEIPKEFKITDSDEYKQAATNSSKKQTIYLEGNEHRVKGSMSLLDGSEVSYYIPSSEFKAATLCGGTPDKRGEQFCQSLPGAVYLNTAYSLSWWKIR